MNEFRAAYQTLSLVRIGVSTLSQRLGSSSVVIIGIAAVVGVFVAMLGIGRGLERTLALTGTDDTAIILSRGAQSETSSSLTIESVALVSQASQVLANQDNRIIFSPEVVLGMPIKKKGTGLDTFIGLRGVGERAWDLWPQVKLIAGRRFRSGLHELVVGTGAEKQFSGLKVGSTVRLDGQSWAVVGTIDTGDAHNSEVWGDAAVVDTTYDRGNGPNSITVRLKSAALFGAFKAELEHDRRLKVDVQTTHQYYSSQSEGYARIIRFVGILISAIMAVGAMLGATNATYTAIASRNCEIATLRAIGFRGFQVLISILSETMLLAAMGGALGAAIAWALFDGFTTSTAGDSGQLVFAFNISPDLLATGLECALTIGLLGGLYPAIRAAHQPIIAGLRDR